MEAQSEVKPNRKRQRKNVKGTPCKSQRISTPIESVFTTKIINLIDDCLVKIFENLDLHSLFNVAVANEWLRPVAFDVYKRKFGKICVNIRDCDDFRPNISVDHDTEHHASAPTEWCNEIYISGLKNCLRYLRCFGSSITELWISYNKSMSKRYGYVHQYINDFCANSLKEITFSRMPNIALTHFQKVFVHVEDVMIRYSVLGEQWPSIVDTFPNLRRLEIDRVDIEHSVTIEKPFEYLEHLKIQWCDTITTNQLANGLLRGVHQLKTLKIKNIREYGPKVPISGLLDMIKDNPSITNLVYSFDDYECVPMNSLDVQRFITEHAALIKLRLKDYLFTAADAVALIGQLHSLTKFQFQLEKSQLNYLASQINDEWDFSIVRTIRYKHNDWIKLTRKM